MPSHQPDYMKGDLRCTLLPTIQEKLQRGLFRVQALAEASPKMKEIVIGLMVHDRELRGTLNINQRKSHRISADESHTDGIIEGLELLVPQSVVVTAMQTKTAYTNISKSISELL
jgi:hypothetical protein